MTERHQEELWTIVLPSGEIRKGTLDQLDEAFNAGHIHSATPVLAPGATAWSTLGALAGLDDAAPPAPSPAVMTSPESLRPVARDVFVEFDDRTMMAPKKSRAGLVIGAFVAVAAIGGGAYVATSGGFASADASKAAAAAPAVTATAAATATATATAPKPAPEPTDDGKPKLTDDQKKALLDADKKLADKMKSKKKDREAAAASAPRRAGPAHDPFARGKGGKCGCNKGDPMCSCL